MQLYYPDFTEDERQRVWQTFIDKLSRERGDTMRMTIDAKEYIASTRKQGINWNGREIRNGACLNFPRTCAVECGRTP